MSTEPIPRTAARVLPVSPSGDVLLVQFADPARPDAPHWVSVGGAIEAGESPEAAARRELWEETGIRAGAGALVGPIHLTEHLFSWDGRDYLSDTTYYALAVDRDVELSFDGLEEAEVGHLLQAGWWTPDALRSDGTAASEDLPDIMNIAIDAVRRGVQ